MKILHGVALGVLFMSVALSDMRAQPLTTHCTPVAPNPQTTPNSRAPKLHATLSAQLGFYGDSRLETLTFYLMNDSDETLDSDTESWTLFIDGKEIDDSRNLFHSGGAPTGGYSKVKSGGTFEFGRALPLAQYFPEDRDYKVYWKASGFESNVAIVRGLSGH